MFSTSSLIVSQAACSYLYSLHWTDSNIAVNRKLVGQFNQEHRKILARANSVSYSSIIPADFSISTINCLCFAKSKITNATNIQNYIQNQWNCYNMTCESKLTKLHQYHINHCSVIINTNHQ